MQNVCSRFTALALSAILLAASGCKKDSEPPQNTTAEAEASNPTAPYRTFIQIQRYTLEKSGNAIGSISNARLEINFPNGGQLPLPDGGQFWPISDGQVQEINRTYELPWNLIQKDGFKFSIQMVRKGSPMLPCEFEVKELSAFNRAYVCRTDVGWQAAHGIPEDKQALEGIQVRVFTDRNSDPKDIPTQTLATNRQ